MFKNIATIVLVLFAAGCASTYEHEKINSANEKFDSSSPIFIATPDDGSYGGERYHGSGEATATAARSEFIRHTNAVEISEKCANVECLINESNGRFGYYVVPIILHWEDRATEWSGKKDKMELKLVIYAGSGEEISSTILSGKRKWASFGGDHTQDLLPDPVNNYVSGLYQ